MKSSALVFGSVLVGSLTLAPGPALGRRSSDGKPTSYSFSSPPVNSMGVRSMTDLRGKPVLIDFWGTR